MLTDESIREMSSDELEEETRQARELFRFLENRTEELELVLVSRQNDLVRYRHQLDTLEKEKKFLKGRTAPIVILSMYSLITKQEYDVGLEMARAHLDILKSSNALRQNEVEVKISKRDLQKLENEVKSRSEPTRLFRKKDPA